MNIKSKTISLSAIASALLVSAISANSANAQEAIITTQALPPVAPAPETPFARALVRLDDLEAQIRNLTNRLELAEAELAEQKAQNSRLAKIIDENRAAEIQTAQKLESEPKSNNEAEKTEAVPSVQVADAAIGSSNAVAADTKPETASIVGSPEPMAKVPVAAAKPMAAPSNVSASAPLKPASVSAPLKPAPVLLSEARLKLQRSEFAAAEAQLVLLTENYPDAAETPEGLWLLGETRFVQKAYNPAALAYVAYLSKAQNGPRASDSLLRLSSAFREIGDNRQRCLAFNEYKKRTPSPTPVQVARANAELAKGPCN